jgi:membrane-bound lytic murein transglycosylase D
MKKINILMNSIKSASNRWWALGGLTFVLSILFVVFTGTDTRKFNFDRVIRAFNLSKTFTFADENFNTSDFDVRERLDRELLVFTYSHSGSFLAMKRSGTHFPTIEKILAEEGLPNDFKYLAVAESGLANVTSPAGAKGYWQFMKGTAGEYGLEVSSEIDERLHLEKSTKAACKYLKNLKNQFGSWALAAAAYNMGGARLTSEKSMQRADSFFDLNLNEETSRYVFRLAAIKEVMTNPKEYGYFLDEKDKYSPLENTKEIVITDGVANWGDFAKSFGMSYRLFKVYNPWLISTSLANPSKKSYTIKVKP